MNWIKYMVVIIFFVGIMVFVALVSTSHQANVTATQEVHLDASAVNVGDARENLEGTMDRETLVSNLMLKIAETHRNHDHETVIDYVFLDEEENPTEDDSNITSVQFEVKLLKREGQVQSTSTERIELDELEIEGGDDNG